MIFCHLPVAVKWALDLTEVSVSARMELFWALEGAEGTKGQGLTTKPYSFVGDV